MIALDNESLALLGAGRRAKVAKLAKPRKATMAGRGKGFDGEVWRTLKAGEVEAFHGKAGSIRRTRKGRTRRLPNGRRWYPAWTDTEQVIAYFPK